MLQRNEGFFLPEMLLSMAAFLMAVSILLPYAVQISRQTDQTRQKSDATTILFDELMFIKITGSESGRKIVLKNGDQYPVAVYRADSHIREVCVQYGNEGKEQCAFSE